MITAVPSKLTDVAVKLHRRTDVAVLEPAPAGSQPTWRFGKRAQIHRGCRCIICSLSPICQIWEKNHVQRVADRGQSCFFFKLPLCPLPPPSPRQHRTDVRGWFGAWVIFNKFPAVKFLRPPGRNPLVTTTRTQYLAATVQRRQSTRLVDL